MIISKTDISRWTLGVWWSHPDWLRYWMCFFAVQRSGLKSPVRLRHAPFLELCCEGEKDLFNLICVWASGRAESLMRFPSCLLWYSNNTASHTHTFVFILAHTHTHTHTHTLSFVSVSEHIRLWSLMSDLDCGEWRWVVLMHMHKPLIIFSMNVSIFLVNSSIKHWCIHLLICIKPLC